MSVSRTNVVYWTRTLYNSDSIYINSIMEQNFNSPIIQRADEYVLCVERFEISLNGIPFYDSSNGESISIYENTDEKTIEYINLDQDSYSLNELIDKINAKVVESNLFSNAGFNIKVDQFGYISIYLDYENYTISLPTELNKILGMEEDDIPNDSGLWISRYPRFDCGDQIDHIRLVSNLDLVSDTIGQAKTNIITDIANSTSIASNKTMASDEYSYSFTPRQRLIYIPYERRILNFSSPIPIQTIRIYAEYVRSNGTSSIIKLPRGASFSIKLGFYKR